MYNELVYRAEFEKIAEKESIDELAEKAWNNYTSIFEDVKQPGKVNLPEGWICVRVSSNAGYFG